MGSEQLILLSWVGSIFALLFAFYQAKKVMQFSEGNDLMKKIAASVRSGANAYLRRQYAVVGCFFVVMFVLLGIMAFTGFLTPFVPFAFITGGFFSGLSASTLPTKSAPTSAALVKIQPPTRANSAIEEAPMPKVSIADEIS